ncbi:MAG: NAD(P)-dependent oxidoreductase [Deltaproteobacteria bacterium]|nr:NAD(P)-dependent oxidoreductase [Deltaproteobacteria bacterium]
MKALVTGGHGFIGSFLVEELLKRNFNVTCLVRASSDTQWIRKFPIQFAQGDLKDPSSLSSLPSDFNYVFHVAGIIKAVEPSEFFKVNHIGTLNLLRHIQNNNQPLKRFVLVSSVAAQGPCCTLSAQSETQESNPVSVYGKSKLAGEKVLHQYGDTIPYTIVRPAVVYGPRDNGVYLFFKALKKTGRIGQVFPKERYYSLVYVEDLVRGIIEAALSEKTTHKTYTLANSAWYSFEKIIQTIGSALSIKPKIIYFPFFFARLAALAGDFYGKLTRKPVFLNSLKLPEFAARYWIFKADKAFQDFQWKSHISLEEGIQKTARWYEENAWL